MGERSRGPRQWGPDRDVRCHAGPVCSGRQPAGRVTAGAHPIGGHPTGSPAGPESTREGPGRVNTRRSVTACCPPAGDTPPAGVGCPDRVKPQGGRRAPLGSPARPAGWTRWPPPVTHRTAGGAADPHRAAARASSAAATGAAQTIPHIAAGTERWPRFTPLAPDRGYRSVPAAPMRHRPGPSGRLYLFRAEPGGNWPNPTAAPPRRGPTSPPSASCSTAPPGTPPR